MYEVDETATVPKRTRVQHNSEPQLKHSQLKEDGHTEQVCYDVYIQISCYNQQ
ncbi:hypothetical protein DPMN_109689 [Dreissena polymorpha]|uniref:Uncharacterized protein n=1 Tax=Dreissena polymorpha TaxID=45954 RepID=A0A9D4KB88_DREPO|nr:hypothetical protein DPMN_109689 [Dreissena polymorpha]